MTVTVKQTKSSTSAYARPNPILCRMSQHLWSKEAREVNNGAAHVQRCERLCGERNPIMKQTPDLQPGEKMQMSFADPWYHTETEELKRLA